jgi:16S rRNA processing protein RimM
VAVEPHSDVPGRFQEGLKLSALAANGLRRDVEVEGFWPHKGFLVLKLASVDSISDAEALVGCELQIPSRARGELEPGWTFISDLAGCMVYDGERELGPVRDVRFGAGEAPLLVVKAGGEGNEKEYEIPFAEAFLKKLDVERKRIVMALPEGLLEINAPLSNDEKRQPGTGKARRK